MISRLRSWEAIVGGERSIDVIVGTSNAISSISTGENDLGSIRNASYSISGSRGIGYNEDRAGVYVVGKLRIDYKLLDTSGPSWEVQNSLIESRLG